ncbi:collagen alpha-5(VI) chain-like [Mytilus trossulus]|uniref:collagen alpha-5(VI) chain-like n=1 Tax=Mytilus trossulus TaxID=6551 RepID=UPI00300402F5
MLLFCKNVLANADIDSGDVRVGILSFTNTAKIEFHMIQYSTKLDVFQAIDKISHISGMTNIAAAFRKVRNEMFPTHHGDRDNVSKVVMLLTDGEISNVNQSETAKEANITRSSNIHVYAIVSNLNKKQEPELLKIVTQPPEDNIMDFTQYANLSSQVFQTTSKGVPTVQVQQSSYFVNTGSSITLGCTVTSNLAVTDVYWQRNIGSSITKIRSKTNNNKYNGITTSTPSLTIFNADQNDVATYTCFAANSVGTGQSTTTQLSVTGKGNILHNISNAEIDKKVLELKKTLEIRKNETARYRSMKTSATDDRLSSAVMGYVGVMVIVAIISLFVFFDCLSIWQYYHDT